MRMEEQKEDEAAKTGAWVDVLPETGNLQKLEN